LSLFINCRARPGDIFLPDFKGRKGYALDFAVTCPVKGTYKANPKAAEQFANEVKLKRYGDGFRGTNVSFIPVVFDTFGGTNDDGGAVLNEIFAECHNRKKELSVNLMWRKTRHALFFHNANMMLRRAVDMFYL